MSHNYIITHKGSMDLDLDNIRVKEIQPVNITTDMGLDNIRIKELQIPTITLKGDGKLDVGLDNVKVTIGLEPVRIHYPVNHRASICLFGRELLSFKLCGESMVVVENYAKRKTEECK